MDIVTQAALGAVVGGAVAGREMGGRALWIGAAAGVFPDSDVLLSPFLDVTTRLLTHRSATHSLLVMPIVALLFAAVAARWRHADGVSFKRWWQLFFWCFITHIALDWCTAYGTQLFFPLTSKPFALSIVFIVDLLYTVPLLVTVAWLIRRRVSPPSLRHIALVGLAISTAYLTVAATAKWYADARVTKVFAQETWGEYPEVRRQITYNSPLNIVLWHTVAMTDDGYLTADYSFLSCGVTNVRKVSAHAMREQILSRAQENRDLARLLWFSRGFFRLTEEDGDMVFTDLRFGYDGSHPFRYHIAEMQDGLLKIHARVRRVVMNIGDTTARLRDLWARIIGCNVTG